MDKIPEAVIRDWAATMARLDTSKDEAGWLDWLGFSLIGDHEPINLTAAHWPEVERKTRRALSGAVIAGGTGQPWRISVGSQDDAKAILIAAKWALDRLSKPVTTMVDPGSPPPSDRSDAPGGLLSRRRPARSRIR